MLAKNLICLVFHFVSAKLTAVYYKLSSNINHQTVWAITHKDQFKPIGNHFIKKQSFD